MSTINPFEPSQPDPSQPDPSQPERDHAREYAQQSASSAPFAQGSAQPAADPTAAPGESGRAGHAGLDALPAGEYPPYVPRLAPTTRAARIRMAALVGGILAIVAVGAGGTYVFQQVGGGGPQPESVMPAGTIAFAKVDLDPSAGQKVDAIRFIRKFPDTKGEVQEDSDLRAVIFKGLQDDGQLKGVDYAKDVEPWLGQRIGIGAVPGATADAEPTAVLALAITDAAKAKASLPTVAKSAGGECEVVKEYAVCTAGTGKLAGIVSAVGGGALADSASFTKDMGDLGEDGVAAAWFDAQQLGKVTQSLRGTGVLEGLPSGVDSAQSGRVAMALRFDGPHLELAGHTNGASVRFVGSEKGTDLADLPKGTLAAVSVANGSEQLKAAWPEIDKSIRDSVGAKEYTNALGEIQRTLGISVPKDLYAVLGSQFSLVFGGMGEGQGQLRIAAVTDGDHSTVSRLADAGAKGMGAGALKVASGDERTVVSLSDDYADEVANESGLGGTEAFKSAVKDADQARIAGFVDIAGVVAAFKDEIGPEEAKNFAGFSALGFSVSGEGTSADFSLRLTTK
ncbi:MAG: DUF3352 domain-containing protein [Pedococcus sp.]